MERKKKTGEKSQIETVSRFVISAVIGAFMGLSYEAINYYHDDYYPVDNLDPKPEAFFVDSIAFHLYARLTRYKKYNVVAYIASQGKTDQLLKLEHALSQWKPKSRDLSRAEFFHKMALIHAVTLCNSFKKEEKHGDHAECDQLLTNLEDFLNRHLQNITLLCNL